MDRADTGVPGHGVSVHPTISLFRPFAGTAEVSHGPAGRDGLAIDIARRSQTDLARHRRCGRLVEQDHAFLPLSDHDQSNAFEGEGLGLGLPAPQSTGERHGLVCGLDAPGDIPFIEEGLNDFYDLDLGVDHRLGMAFEESIRPRQPPASNREGLTTGGKVSEDHGNSGGPVSDPRSTWPA